MLTSFDYGISVNPIQSDPKYAGYGWCGFLTLATIIGGDPCTYAADYYANYEQSKKISGCNSTDGIAPINIRSFYGKYNVILGPGVWDDCSLIAGVNPNKALLITIPGHVYVLYGFHRKEGPITMDKYDTSDTAGWDRPGLPLNFDSPNAAISH